MAEKGADPDSLKSLANQMRKGAEAIDALKGSISATLSAASWKGPDCEAYKSTWSGSSSQALSKAVADLTAVADSLVKQAVAQIAASAADGSGYNGSGGGGTGGAGGSGAGGDGGDTEEVPSTPAEIAAKIKEFADELNVPASVIAAAAQVMGWKKLMDVGDALKTGDPDVIAKALDPETLENIEKLQDADPGSYASVKSWFQAQEDLGADAAHEAASAAAPLDSLGEDASLFAKGSDLLGKVAAPLAVGADLYSVFNVSGDEATSDRIVSGVQLGGLGLAAAGTEVGGAALGLLGVDAVAAPIPVVGEVVVAGTALYMGGKFLYDNSQTIHDGVDAAAGGVWDATKWTGNELANVGSDIGNAASSVGNDLGHAASSVGSTISGGAKSVWDAVT